MTRPGTFRANISVGVKIWIYKASFATEKRHLHVVTVVVPTTRRSPSCFRLHKLVRLCDKQKTSRYVYWWWKNPRFTINRRHGKYPIRFQGVCWCFLASPGSMLPRISSPLPARLQLMKKDLFCFFRKTAVKSYVLRAIKRPEICVSCVSVSDWSGIPAFTVSFADDLSVRDVLLVEMQCILIRSQK